MLRKPCRLQTDGRTDGQGESSIPPSNFVGRGYKKKTMKYQRLDMLHAVIILYMSKISGKFEGHFKTYKNAMLLVSKIPF